MAHIWEPDMTYLLGVQSLVNGFTFLIVVIYQFAVLVVNYGISNTIVLDIP